MIEKRREPRHKFQILVLNEKGYNILGFTSDISLSGCFISNINLPGDISYLNAIIDIPNSQTSLKVPITKVRECSIISLDAGFKFNFNSNIDKNKMGRFIKELGDGRNNNIINRKALTLQVGAKLREINSLINIKKRVLLQKDSFTTKERLGLYQQINCKVRALISAEQALLNKIDDFINHDEIDNKLNLENSNNVKTY